MQALFHLFGDGRRHLLFAAQAQLITTLGQLPMALAASGLGSPSIIVIGDVVRCAAISLSPAEIAVAA